jgi:sugar lactone lactonase YvrE
VGPEGALYLADSGNCRVRRVGPEGRIATVAGGDACGYAGDGGPASQAQLLRPYDLALDQDGNLYVADLRTFTVRKVDRQGMISTVAGVGISRPIDIGGYDPTNGLLCSLHNLPVPAPSYLADGGPANQAGLYFPYGIALGHDGHLYIADTFDHRVRRVTCGAGVPCAGPADPTGSQPSGVVAVASATPDAALPLSSTDQPARPNETTLVLGLVAGVAVTLLLLGAVLRRRVMAQRREGAKRTGGMS